MTASVTFSDTNEQLGFTDGGDYNFTNMKIGFGAESGNLVGISSNNQTRDTVVLESNPATPVTRKLGYRLTAGQKVEFYVNGQLAGETTTVPNGPVKAEQISNALAKNPNGTDQTVSVGEAIGVQLP